MSQQNNDNNNQQFLCCPPMTEETALLKKIKPLLLSGVCFYFILLFLDILYLEDYNLFLYTYLIICLGLLAFNRCFLVFHFYSIATIFLLFGTALPSAGIIIQCKFKKDKTSDDVIKFLIYLSTIVFTCILYYFCFKGYREMKYLFENMISSNPQAIPSYMGGLMINTNQQNYNYGNNDGNNYNNYNNNNNNTRGYQAFSGRGYRVGGN